MSRAGHDSLNASHDATMTSRRRVRSRWWLAGLLVGCLLPAGLGHGDAVRLVNRVVQICWLVPDTIRAESRRLARRQRWQPAVRRRPSIPRRCSWRPFPRLLRRVAGHDVLTRRGPPRLFACGA